MLVLGKQCLTVTVESAQILDMAEPADARLVVGEQLQGVEMGIEQLLEERLEVVRRRNGAGRRRRRGVSAGNRGRGRDGLTPLPALGRPLPGRAEEEPRSPDSPRTNGRGARRGGQRPGCRRQTVAAEGTGHGRVEAALEFDECPSGGTISLAHRVAWQTRHRSSPRRPIVRPQADRSQPQSGSP
ncbi:MAG: hypothetical protein V7607_5606 [Solirubrobacteraceae bacterium]